MYRRCLVDGRISAFRAEPRCLNPIIDGIVQGHDNAQNCDMAKAFVDEIEVRRDMGLGRAGDPVRRDGKEEERR
jgi:hypothetical protein